MGRPQAPPEADRLYYEYGADGWVYLYFDYDPTVVEAIKFAVPYGSRRWIPDRRSWWIASAFWPRLRKTLVDCGVFAHSEFEELKVKGGGTAWSTLYLVNGAPPEVIDAAYRALAKLHHPDRATDVADLAGRTQRMTTLNLAYEKLTEGK